MIALGLHRIKRPRRLRRHDGPASLTALRWAVWLGANTPARLAIARGVTRLRAAEQLCRGYHAGVLVRIGTVKTATRPAPVYATPDPEQFPHED